MGGMGLHAAGGNYCRITLRIAPAMSGRPISRIARVESKSALGPRECGAVEAVRTASPGEMAATVNMAVLIMRLSSARYWSTSKHG